MGTKKRPIWEMVGAFPVCRGCGSKAVVRDAWAEWSMASQNWQLKTVFDHFACDNCGDEGLPDWRIDEAFRTKRIRRLNDQLRKGQAENATVVITHGIQAEGEEFARRAVGAVMAFEEFTEDNDPHGEHDFGAVLVDEEKLFFKIDYFDPELERHSDDAADPACTHRVLTIMLASEY